MEEVPMTVLKRRFAVERWKAINRDYYLAQKRQLASRSEYLAHRRAVYAAQQAELARQAFSPEDGGGHDSMRVPRLWIGAESAPGPTARVTGPDIVRLTKQHFPQH